MNGLVLPGIASCLLVGGFLAYARTRNADTSPGEVVNILGRIAIIAGTLLVVMQIVLRLPDPMVPWASVMVGLSTGFAVGRHY